MPTPRRGQHHSGDQARDRLGRWVASDPREDSMSESEEEAVVEVPTQDRGKTVILIESDEEDAKNSAGGGKGHSRRSRKMEKRGDVKRKQIQDVGISSSKKRGKGPELESSGKKGKQRLDDYNQGGSSEDSGYDTEELQDTLDEYGEKFAQAERMMLEDIERNHASAKKAISGGFEWLYSELLDVMFRPKKKGGKVASKK